MDLLTDHEGDLTLQSARNTVENAVAGTTVPALKLTPVFQEKRGVFVTLTKVGCHWGCIGFPYRLFRLKRQSPRWRLVQLSKIRGSPR